VTRLRKTMLEELDRRNFSQNTTRTYVRIVEDFARYFHRQPDQLGHEHIREYQAHLFRQRKLAANTVTQACGGHPLPLRQDAQEAMERGGDSLSQESRSSAGDPEPGRTAAGG
jgi:hypothetical protein